LAKAAEAEEPFLAIGVRLMWLASTHGQEVAVPEGGARLLPLSMMPAHHQETVGVFALCYRSRTSPRYEMQARADEVGVGRFELGLDWIDCEAATSQMPWEIYQKRRRYLAMTTGLLLRNPQRPN
jgi:hypothetical protein